MNRFTSGDAGLPASPAAAALLAVLLAPLSIPVAVLPGPVPADARASVLMAPTEVGVAGTAEVGRPPGGPDLEDALRRARRVLDSLARAGGGAGLQAALARGDSLLWTEGFGLADAEAGRPVTPLTRFRIYSLAKPMTAVAAARLREAGRLDLRASVREYVPSFPRKNGPVTPMHLLRHTSGIRHYRDEAEARNLRHCDSVADALPIFAGDPLVHPPGARQTYSTWGYVLLSAVIESAAARPYAAHMREDVFKPAGLRHTVIDDPTREIPDRAAFYRLPPPGGSQAAATPGAGREGAAPATRLRPAEAVDNTCKWGGGGWLSTAADVARFFGATAAGKLVAPATLRQLTGGTTAYEAMGLGAGGMAFLRVDLETGLVFVVLSNTTGEAFGPAVQDAVPSLYRRFGEAVTSR